MLDVLSVLVFFLLFHSFNGDLPEQRIKLPTSVVETKPRETVVISITTDAVLVQGEAVINTSELLDDKIGTVREVTERLRELAPNISGESKEITLLADKSISFNVIKKIMTCCTASGFGRISLAVTQKATQG
jgi:biopolymer transport protein ExbD